MKFITLTGSDNPKGQIHINLDHIIFVSERKMDNVFVPDFCEEDSKSVTMLKLSDGSTCTVEENYRDVLNKIMVFGG